MKCKFASAVCVAVVTNSESGLITDCYAKLPLYHSLLLTPIISSLFSYRTWLKNEAFSYVFTLPKLPSLLPYSWSLLMFNPLKEPGMRKRERERERERKRRVCVCEERGILVPLAR